MKMAVGGGGVFGMSKGKIQPTGNLSKQPPLHHTSGCSGRQPPTGTERQGKDWAVNIHVYETHSPVHSRAAQ